MNAEIELVLLEMLEIEPFIDNDFGDTPCFYCGEERPNHEKECPFVKLQALLLAHNAREQI